MNFVIATLRAARPQRHRRDIFVESAPPTSKPRQGRHIPPVRPPMPPLRSWNHFDSTFYKYAAPLVLPMNVPQGQPTIARRFNGGSASTKPFKSRRDGRKSLHKTGMVCRPFGTFSIGAHNPRLKPWAIIKRLSGA